jgi:hypothetical protein
LQEADRRFGDHGAGGKMAEGSGLVHGVEILGGITPPTTIMMSSRP